MLEFSIGLSALSTNQRLLDLVGENIANANTPGYHRQVALLTEKDPTLLAGLMIGNGVQINQISRLRDFILEQAATQNTFQSGSTTAQLGIAQQIEAALTPGTGSLDNLLAGFFNQLSQVASSPADTTQRQVLLGDATALTNQLNSLGANFAGLRQNVDSELQQTVTDVNTLIPQIAALNQEIQRVEVLGTNNNDARDQRDQLINQLAGLVDVRTIEQPFGQTTVLVDGSPVVIGNQFNKVQFTTDASGNAIVTMAGSKTPLNLVGGKLAGLLQIRNQTLPAFSGQLDTLAHSLIQQVDEIQATGLGLGGPSTFASGTRAVSSVTVPLSQAKLAFPPQAGSLFVTVTDLATGTRTLSQVALDPSTQSLQAVAAALSAVPHLQAIADAPTGTLKILAQPGYAFDFAGRLASAPDTVSITGTTVPQIGGTYTGTTNDVLTYQVVGNGTVGVTPNLTLQVQNSAGSVIASLNIGQGYQPGSTLQVGNGVTVALSSGTANNGDSFTTRVVANPDTARILTSLGINTFFTGDNANNIAVQPNLVNSPDQLAASRTGQSGDGSNLQRMAALADQPLLANGTQTFSQFYSTMVGDSGTQVQQLSDQQSAQQLIGQRIEAQQQAVSGVDPNEELVRQLEAQRAFEMAAKYISTVNTTLDSLFQIIDTTASGAG